MTDFVGWVERSEPHQCWSFVVNFAALTCPTSFDATSHRQSKTDPQSREITQFAVGKKKNFVSDCKAIEFDLPTSGRQGLDRFGKSLKTGKPEGELLMERSILVARRTEVLPAALLMDAAEVSNGAVGPHKSLSLAPPPGLMRLHPEGFSHLFGVEIRAHDDECDRAAVFGPLALHGPSAAQHLFQRATGLIPGTISQIRRSNEEPVRPSSRVILGSVPFIRSGRAGRGR